MKTFVVIRYIIEKYSVDANTKKEAKEIIEERGNPYSITVTKETIKET